MFSDSWPIFYYVVLFSCGSLRVIYMFWIKILYRVWISNSFSYHSLSFHSHKCTVHSVNVFNLNIVYLFLSVIDFSFAVLSKNYLPNSRSQRYSFEVSFFNLRAYLKDFVLFCFVLHMDANSIITMC